MNTVARVLALLALSAGHASASGWLLGSYSVPDTATCYVYATLCQSGTCTAKTLWDQAGGYGVPIHEGAPGDTVRFRFTLSSSGAQNVILYVWRESVYNRMSSPVQPMRIVTQAAGADRAWAGPDSALVAWAEPVQGTSPLAPTYAHTFTAHDPADVQLLDQNAVQHAMWNQRREHLRQIIDVAEWPGWWLPDGGYVQ